MVIAIIGLYFLSKIIKITIDNVPASQSNFSDRKVEKIFGRRFDLSAPVIFKYLFILDNVQLSFVDLI
jgi:hypothetical protein